MNINDISKEELLELYKEHGSTYRLKAHLQTQGCSASVRTIQYRLKEADPEYSLLGQGAGRPKKEKAETKEDLRPIAAGTVAAPDELRSSLDGKRFVFTSAQNNTYVHKGFLQSLKNFCNFNDADLVVSTFTYNKHGFQNGTKQDDGIWFDPSIRDYIHNDSYEVARGLVFCGELDILPTAVNPLSGLENYTRNNSGIVPHAKVQMQSMPRMAGEDARFMYTTGAVTLRNYIQRKAGQKAEFHHVFAALYVEIDENGTWFARQLVADKHGVFHDLDVRYSPEGTEHSTVLGITWGDIHMEKIDNGVFNLAWGQYNYSMLHTLQPTYQFIHDLTDFRARNHHNIKDPHFLAKIHHLKQGNVSKDLHTCGAFLDFITRAGTKTIVVESNHDQALVKWLKEADVRQDPENAEFYHLANSKIYKNIRENSTFNVFEWAVSRGMKNKDKVQFLNEDDSFLVADIEHGMHGHRGANGARGNPRGFRSLGRKVNIGHMHSAGIIDGVYVAGVSGQLDMDYNKGPSSWSHSHIVTYANGKRAIITMKDGKWRA